MNDRHRSNNHQPTYIALPHLRGTAELLLATTRVLSRDEAKLGSKIATASELLHRRRKGCDCHSADRPDTWHFLEPSYDIVLFCFSSDTTIDLIDLLVQLSNLTKVPF